MTRTIIKILCVFTFIIVQTSCTKDDESKNVVENFNPDENDEEEENPIEEEINITGDTGNLTIYKKSLVDDSYLLVNDASDNRVYLMSKENGKILHEWNIPEAGIGNDAELLETGQLLASLKDPNAVFDLGGYGGRMQIINPDHSIAWDYTYSSEDYISHHDIEMLPNGNVMLIAWQKKTKEEAEAAGYLNFEDLDDYLLYESLIEINPDNNEIVWEWHAWDHLIQDLDDTKLFYGNVNENPQLIDINYNHKAEGNFMHANGFDYDHENDLVYVSINFYSEVWVIDHSTSTEEASSNSGGNYNKGGDLVYRFGNPSVYKNDIGERLFFNNHFPNILENNELGKGNVLIYVNNHKDGLEQSTVYELKIPSLELFPNQDNEPSIVWSYTDSELYSPIVSGAVRLTNGNTLITEGRYGYWEVTEDGELVWEFEGNKLFWRGYAYPLNSSPIQNLGLQFVE